MRSLEVARNAVKYITAWDIVEKGDRRTNKIRNDKPNEGINSVFATEGRVFVDRIRTLGEQQVTSALRISGVYVSARFIKKVL